MRASLIALLLLVLIVPAVYAQAAMPRMTSVNPDTGKSGEIVTVAGENLQKENVAELFLTDGKSDLKVAITEQAATSIKFKIPENAKAGRFALMILTGGKEPKLIEQPVKVTVQ